MFCHEEQAVEEFKRLNDQLRDSADKANRYANLMMPVNANIGNLSYVLCAVFGALLALSGAAGTTVGTIIAFLGLNRNFTQPIAQISQQMTFIVMGQAGANRVFELLDQEPEEDHGYVTPVSYTHLDVYKRQLPDLIKWMKMWWYSTRVPPAIISATPAPAAAPL